VLIVDSDQAAVEQSLVAGELACPDCRGVLRPWGSARTRAVREHAREMAITPRRSCCSSCAKTHVLVADTTLPRRRDALASIGTALVRKAAGEGRRKIGAALLVHPDTVRGWLRRFAVRAEAWRAHCSAWAHALDASLPAIEPAGSPFADALFAIGLAACAATRRFGPRPGWGWVAVITAGGLLANTSSPSPAT
jgi:hypothetical protein